jgi:hypothetical protein
MGFTVCESNPSRLPLEGEGENGVRAPSSAPHPHPNLDTTPLAGGLGLFGATHALCNPEFLPVRRKVLHATLSAAYPPMASMQ